jgi:hypothetical protein
VIDAATRRLVRQRAEHRCEYCHTNQDDEPFITYQVEHIVAKQHDGSDVDSNLALACSHCNRHKGPNLAGIDPDSGNLEAIFHPRLQSWSDHFEVDGPVIIGHTPCGRATVRVLAMNAQQRLELRQEIVRLREQ